MKTIQTTIKYCCDDTFKKLYGKYIRAVKKQYGKKKFHQLTIIAEESVNPIKPAKYISNKNPLAKCCKKCYCNGAKYTGIEIKEMKMTIVVPDFGE